MANFQVYPTNFANPGRMGTITMTLNIMLVLRIITHAQGFEYIKIFGGEGDLAAPYWPLSPSDLAGGPSTGCGVAGVGGAVSRAVAPLPDAWTRCPSINTLVITLVTTLAAAHLRCVGGTGPPWWSTRPGCCWPPGCSWCRFCCRR